MEYDDQLKEEYKEEEEISFSSDEEVSTKEKNTKGFEHYEQAKVLDRMFLSKGPVVSVY